MSARATVKAICVPASLPASCTKRTGRGRLCRTHGAQRAAAPPSKGLRTGRIYSAPACTAQTVWPAPSERSLRTQGQRGE